MKCWVSIYGPADKALFVISADTQYEYLLLTQQLVQLVILSPLAYALMDVKYFHSE